MVFFEENYPFYGVFRRCSLHYEKFQDGTVKCIEDEIPFEVPKGWEWSRLGSIANIVTGRLDANAQTTDGEYPFFTCGEEVFKTDSYAFDCNAILLGGNNATGDFKMHKFSGKFNAYQRVYVITTFSEIDVNYLYNHIRYYLPKLQSQSIGSQTRYLKLGMITELLIALPTSCEQKIISESCNKYLNYCTEIAYEKDTFKNIIKSAKSKILDLAIRGKLVPQDPNDEPASVLLERIRAEKEELIKQGKIKRDKKESIIFRGDDNSYYEKIGNTVECIDTEIPFEIPNSWLWCRLESIGNWQTGSTPSRRNEEYYSGNIPWIKTGDLNNGYIIDIPEYITEKALNETAVKLIPSGTVLIAMYGATIGKVGITTCEATTNQACCACCHPYGVLPEYLFYYLQSQKESFINMAEGGAQPNISKEKIVGTLIPVPPYEKQTQIINIIKFFNKHIDSIEKSLS